MVTERGCVFFNESQGSWSDEGCEVDKAKSNSTHVCCLCNHLTSFTVSAKGCVQVLQSECCPHGHAERLAQVQVA